MSTSYNPCPDEKGTERTSANGLAPPLGGYNPCPDEKGTESPSILDVQFSRVYVTTRAPMKRGLKAADPELTQYATEVTTRAPMKRGLKDNFIERSLTFGGVTTRAPMKRGLKGIQDAQHLIVKNRYNPCPDEKGTERNLKNAPPAFAFVVTTRAPMKRGLKVPYHHWPLLHLLKLQPVPR